MICVLLFCSSFSYQWEFLLTIAVFKVVSSSVAVLKIVSPSCALHRNVSRETFCSICFGLDNNRSAFASEGAREIICMIYPCWVTF